MLREPQHPHEELRGQGPDDAEEEGIQEQSRPVSKFHANFLPFFGASRMADSGKFWDAKREQRGLMRNVVQTTFDIERFALDLHLDRGHSNRSLVILAQAWQAFTRRSLPRRVHASVEIP